MHPNLEETISLNFSSSIKLSNTPNENLDAAHSKCWSKSTFQLKTAKIGILTSFQAEIVETTFVSSHFLNIQKETTSFPVVSKRNN